MAKNGKNKGLGRGLDALFADAGVSEKKKTVSRGAADGGESVLNVKIDDIKPNSGQPRKTFSEEALQELADSITEHGILQPILLRPSGKGYEIVAGERRYRAARIAGLKEVPAIVRELSDSENMLVAIIENMQREDLNPMEEAEGLQSMINEFGLTQSEVSQGVGKSRPYIANSLRLLKLEPEIRKLIAQGDLSAGHGRTILACKTKKERIALAKKAVKEKLSVRELEDIVGGERKAKKRAKPLTRRKPTEVLQVEGELKDSLGTKVNIVQRGEKGKIEIEYYSADERERLIDILRAADGSR